jgi:hypothetical protein
MAVSSAKSIEKRGGSRLKIRSLMKMIKSKGPKMLPCGTPQKIGDLEENLESTLVD